MNDFRVSAQSAEKFKRISGSRLRRKYTTLVTSVLKTNFIALNYPDVEIDGVLDKNEFIILKVINCITNEYMEFSIPVLEDGKLCYRAVEFGRLSSTDGEWNIRFEDYQFSSNLCNLSNENSLVKGLTVSGSLAGVSIESKISLICDMVKKLEFFFLFSVEYSPEKIMDIMCQALVVSPSNIYDLTISIGNNTILRVSNGEIKDAMIQKKDFKVKISSDGIARYWEENFELMQSQPNQSNKVRFEECFQENFDTEKLKAKIDTAQKEIRNLLHEVALCNKKMSVTITQI